MKKTALFIFVTLLLSFFSLAQASELRVVPNKDVCMVTNMHFGKTQIPVQQGGKTYYGCCEMCKTTLATDASSRLAVDPISKASVDKAKAVIGAFSDGSVVYFENQNNFNKYKSQLNKSKKPST